MVGYSGCGFGVVLCVLKAGSGKDTLLASRSEGLFFDFNILKHESGIDDWYYLQLNIARITLRLTVDKSYCSYVTCNSMTSLFGPSLLSTY